jgi:IS5 family transposase
VIGRVSRQMHFYDKEIFERIPKKNVLVKIKKVVDFDAMARKIEGHYARHQGRRSWPIVTMIKSLFLEIHFNLSDREFERQLGYNYLYRWFLDLSFYDKVPDATSLCVFRSRIGEDGAREIFDEIVSQAKEAGVLKGRVKAVDATHVEANAAKRNVVNSIRHARKKVLGIFKKEKPEEARELGREYVDKNKTYHKSTKEEIEKEVKKTREFINELRVFCVDRVEPWLNLLKEMLEKIIKEEADRIASFVDTDARWGHKTPEKTFFGYKVHTVQDESRIVTSVETLHGNENEGAELTGILKEDKRKGIEGTGVVADKLYDSGKNRKEARKLGLVPHILSRTTRRKADGFTYDPEGDILKCKGGKEPRGKTRQGEGYLHYFSVSDCKECSCRDECLGDNENRQRVYLSDAEQERLLAGKGVTRKEARRIRCEIEPKYGEGKMWHGLGRARWRGKWRMGIQSFITFGVMNVKRLVKLIEETEKKLCPS